MIETAATQFVTERRLGHIGVSYAVIIRDDIIQSRSENFKNVTHSLRPTPQCCMEIAVYRRFRSSDNNNNNSIHCF